MNEQTSGKEFLKELESEVPATRHCLERISEKLFDYKPHEKSMNMGYLSLLVAEIPLWIKVMIEEGEINFTTFKHFQPKTTQELVDHFDENLNGAKAALDKVSNEGLKKPFRLKNGEHVIMEMPVGNMIGSTINHWVHHRGQLTVYMRLCNILVPSIYGPSADDKGSYQ